MMFVLIHSIHREDSADQSQSADPQVQRERQVGAKQSLKPVFTTSSSQQEVLM